MPTPSGSAYFFLDQGGQSQATAAGGTLPDPVTLGVTEVIVDGKKVQVTATSGVQQYQIVKPDDYPTDRAGVERRRGCVRGGSK